MSSLLVSNRSYDRELCHLDKMPQNDNSHLVEFQRLLEAGDFEGALEQAKAFLLNLSPIEGQEQLSNLCDALENFLLNLSTEEKERLLLRFIEKIKEFPDLNLEKARALTWYGELFLTKESEYSNLCASMRSLATGYVQDPTQERAQKLFDPILPIVYKNFEKQLCRLAGTGEVAAFQQLVETFCSRFAYREDISIRFYQIAYSVYRGLNEKNQKAFTPLLTQLQQGTRGELPFVKAVPPTTVYKEKLQAVRSHFTDEEETRSFQKNRAKEFREFYAYLFEEALFIFGPPPCKYDIRAMGSLAREEVCPYSDIEYFIQIEDETYRENFQEIAKIFHLQILSLGETDSKHQGSLNFGQKCGLEIDNQADPAFQSLYIGTAEVLFLPPSEQNHDDYKSYKSRFHSVSILGNHTFRVPRLRDLDFLEKLLQMRREAFATLNPLQGGECKLKDEFMGPLSHYLGELGLYYGLEETNTLDLIDKLPCFTDLSRVLLKEAVSAIYQMRIRIHLQNEGLLEDAALPPSLSPVVLTTEEKNTLERIRDLVLIPLYEADLSEKSIELVGIAMPNSPEERVEFIALYLQNAPFKVHRTYYETLTAPEHVHLQAIYLEHVPETIAQALAILPNRAGFRQSRSLEEKEFVLSLEEISTTNPESGVKIATPLHEEERYLTVEAARQLLDPSGHIRKSYSDALHNVSQCGKLHFKEFPYQPMMQYAKDSLIHRIMGKAAPTTTLARFEVMGKNLAYPVLISETVQGERIDSSTSFFSRHLTWLCLCEILTKPGDGRIPNYIVNQGKIYCIDNDVTFIEPMAQNFFGRLQVNFCSALFTLDQPLDKEVLNRFCALEPDLILNDWVEELQEQEKRYLALFPDEKELRQFYEQDKEQRFTPTLLLPRGAFATLCTQFYHLQRVLRQNHFEEPTQLLRALITLGEEDINKVGRHVEREYEKALALPPQKRLAAATKAKSDKSLTSVRAMELGLKKIPTFEQLSKQKRYSLQEAAKELSLVHVHKFWNRVCENGRECSMEVDFSAFQDNQREVLMLRSLRFLHEADQAFLQRLSLRNSHTSKPKIFEQLLNPDLRVLDLSHALWVTDEIVALIVRKCPKLEELHLEGCPHIRSLDLHLPHLKVLNLSRSHSLLSLKSNSSELEELNISRCVRLKKVETSLQPRTQVECEETPDLEDPNFSEQLYQLGRRFAQGDGVPKDYERALELWEKAASHNHSDAQKERGELLYRLGKQYAEGDGVPKDPERAVEFWQKAASAKHEYAQKIVSWIDHIGDSTSLTFSSTAIGEESTYALAEVLKLNRVLVTLNLEGCTIGDKGACVLAGVLRVNRVLQSLNLRGNKIGDRGATALADALKNNDTLQVLTLESNDIGNRGASAFATTLKENQSLVDFNLNKNKIGPPGSVQLAEALKINRGLTILNLEENEIGDSGICAIADALEVNQVLTNIYVKKNQFAQTGSCALVRALRVNHTIISLDLGGCKLDDQGISMVVEVLKVHPTLRSLSLAACGITDKGACDIAESLKDNQVLETLILRSNSIKKEGARAFSALLEVNRSLKELALSFNPIGDEGASALSVGLKVNPTLTHLWLVKIEMRDDGACAIGDALEANRALEEVWLGGNFIGDVGACVIGDALKVNCSVTGIYLQENRIRGEGASAIADALKVNFNIRKILLYKNPIGDFGACAFADALRVNTSLTSIALFSCEICRKGACALAEALKNHRFITHLLLGNNLIGDVGAAAFSETLKVNRSLTKLNLYNNRIGNLGANVLAQGLQMNDTLTELDLNSNEIGDEGACDFAKALRVNRALIYLKLENSKTKLGKRGAHALISAMEINNTLIYCSIFHLGRERLDALADKVSDSSDKNIELRRLANRLASENNPDVEAFANLLDQGVSLYHWDATENSFLHLAATYGSRNMAKLLLERSKNPTFKNWVNKENKTALDLARENGHQEIVTLLSEKDIAI